MFKRIITIFSAFLLVAVIGCDGNGGGDETSDDGGTGDSSGTTIVIASGSETVAGGTPIVEFKVDKPGKLQAKMTWTAPPTELELGFVHEGILVKLTKGDSTLKLTKNVSSSDVAAGVNWELYGGNSGPNVVVNYQVKFTPD